MYWIMIVIVIMSCNGYYLSKLQKQQIKVILQDPDISMEKKQKIKKVLVSKYSWWAMGKAKKFQEENKIRPNYIRSSELLQASLVGLVKSMDKYDGRVEVPYYSSYYIKDELYRQLTRSQPFGRFSHYEMMTLKKNPMNHSRVEAMGQNRQYIENTQFFHEDNRENGMEDMKAILEKMDAKDRRIFFLRFDIETGKKRYNLKEVGELMDCSIETVRKSINKTRTSFKNYLLRKNTINGLE